VFNKTSGFGALQDQILRAVDSTWSSMSAEEQSRVLRELEELRSDQSIRSVRDFKSKLHDKAEEAVSLLSSPSLNSSLTHPLRFLQRKATDSGVAKELIESSPLGRLLCRAGFAETTSATGHQVCATFLTSHAFRTTELTMFSHSIRLNFRFASKTLTSLLVARHSPPPLNNFSPSMLHYPICSVGSIRRGAPGLEILSSNFYRSNLFTLSTIPVSCSITLLSSFHQTLRVMTEVTDDRSVGCLAMRMSIRSSSFLQPFPFVFGLSFPLAPRERGRTVSSVSPSLRRAPGTKHEARARFSSTDRTCAEARGSSFL